MAFPSPAVDYREERVTPAGVMGITDSSIAIQTDEGYAVAEPALPAKKGKMVLLQVSGKLLIGEVGNGNFIVNDGII